MSVTPTESQLDDDKKLLHSMGYAQELLRGMRTFSNFAISFSIICILSGGINSFSQGLSSVGGASIGLGWPLASVALLMFALAMGQIGSAYPTAGGLYHWASILGGRGLGWVTAWANMIGLVTGLASVNVGTYLFLVGSLGPAFGLDVAKLTPSAPTAYSIGIQTVAVIAITLSQGLFNHLGIKLTAKLTDLSGYLIFFVSLGLAATVVLFARHLDPSRLWTFSNFSGEAGGGVWPKSSSLGYLFLLGLILPAYTITGFDASAHTAEETVQAARAIPKGMIHAVAWSGLVGWIMLSAIVIAVPSLPKVAGQGANGFFSLMGEVVPVAPRLILFALIGMAQYLCGLATVTSASRMVFAFARDGGLPFSSALKTVSPRYRTPVHAIWTVAILATLFTIYTPVFTTLVAVCTIFVYFSYVLPITAGLFAHGRSWTKMGPFDLKWAYRPVAVLCILGCATLVYIGIQPPNDQAAKVIVGAAAVALVLWFGLERRRFAGPPTGNLIAQRQSQIVAAEHAVGED